MHHHYIRACGRAVQAKLAEFHRRAEILEKLAHAVLAAILAIDRHSGARFGAHGGKAHIIGAALQHRLQIARRKIGKNLLTERKRVHIWLLG